MKCFSQMDCDIIQEVKAPYTDTSIVASRCNPKDIFWVVQDLITSTMLHGQSDTCPEDMAREFEVEIVYLHNKGKSFVLK